MLNGRKIVSLCTTRLNEVENCRFITELNKGLNKANASLFVYNINTEMYWSDDNIRAEAAVFGLVDYSITDVVVVMYEKIKNRSIAEKIISDARSHNIPVVIADAEYEGCISISFNYKKGFETIVRHVIEHHGVKRPHMMAGIKDNPFSDERIEAFKKVIEENGIPFSQEMVSYGEFWAQPCRNAMEELLASGRDVPEAIICANDIMAINVCSVLNGHGYKVPDDVIVTGFDGIDEINLFIPRLTSSYCGSAGMAPDMVKLITDILDEKEVAEVNLVEPELLINRSCGCRCDTEETPDDIFGFNNRFYRYQDDFQTYFNMSEGMIGSDTLESCAQKMFDMEIDDVTVIINKKLTDFTQNHFTDTSRRKFDEDMFIFYESDRAVFSQQDFKRSRIVPHLDQFMSYGSPLVFNVIAFMNVPIGYICFHLPKFDISDYCKIPQLVNSIGSGVGGFINTRYQHYLTERIEKMYKYDSLTNLYNRLSFNNEFEKMKRSFEGRKVPLNVILIDLDGLKYINDNYGHGAGDNAIRVIATALKEACPDDALCVRFGGDEMLAVIPGDNSPDEIKQDINRRITRYNNKECKPYLISASTGIYRTDSTQNTDFEYLVKEADAKMYAEKLEKRKQH